MSCLRGLFREHKQIPVKVQDCRRERRIGFVAKSLGQLRKKACLKFQVRWKQRSRSRDLDPVDFYEVSNGFCPEW